jgi:hypothetical protein
MTFFIFLFAYLSLYSQACVLPVPLDDRISQSGNIIEGEVVDRVSSWNAAGTSIYTIYTLKVLNPVKGNVEGDHIRLVERGGLVGNALQVDHPALHFRLGDTGLFFLQPVELEFENLPGSAVLFSLNFSMLGHVRYDLVQGIGADALTVYPDLVRDVYSWFENRGISMGNGIAHRFVSFTPGSRAISISSFSPSSVTAGTGTQLTISGSGFGALQGSGKVEFANADDGGAGYVEPEPWEYVSWTNTQIVVDVPSGAGSGQIRITNNGAESVTSSAPLFVEYNLLNISYNNETHFPNLIDADGSGGYEFVFHDELYNDPGAYPAFLRAFDSWRCNNGGGSGIHWTDGGSSGIDVAIRDGVNIVRFDNDELSINVLGRATSYYTGCASGADWFLEEVDLVFNESPYTAAYSWNYEEGDNTTSGNEFDFESVAVHELGHAHQLGHVTNTGEIMYFSISNGTENRDLQPGDLDGAGEALSMSQGVCGEDVISMGYFCQTLPLEIFDFSVSVYARDKVICELEWYTDDLHSSFELEKSADGIHFDRLKLIEELLTGVNRFIYLDNEPFYSTYYRCKMTDSDGQISYSRIRRVVLSQSDARDIGFYPNPVNDRLYIENETSLSVERLRIRSMQGSILLEIPVPGSSLDLSPLPSGAYLLEYWIDSRFRSRMLIKQ